MLGLVFYSAGQFGLTGNMFDNFRVTVENGVNSAASKIYSSVFPKSEKEILINNLESDYNYMDKFFSDTAPKILQSKNISEQDKKAIDEAMVKFNESKKSIQAIKTAEQSNKGIVETIVSKLLKTKTPLAEPTSIPPQCRLECP